MTAEEQKKLEKLREHVDRCRAILDLLRTDDNAATIPFNDAYRCLTVAADELETAMDFSLQIQESMTQ